MAVIAVIIWVAFLRPADPGDLSGIEAEGSPPVAIDPGPGASNRDSGRAMPSGPGGPKAEGVTPGEGQLDLPAPGPGGGERGERGPASSSDDALTTPSDDQYDDLVARLMKRVGSPAAFNDLETQP